MELFKMLLAGEGAGVGSCRTEEEKELQYCNFYNEFFKALANFTRLGTSRISVRSKIFHW